MEPKPHKAYLEQVALLKEHGMHVEDDTAAVRLLQRVGYYTLSGYSYSFRLKSLEGIRTDQFRSGTTLVQIQSLWEFDSRLRGATFASLQHVETCLRARLGYLLGEIDPLVHLKPNLLSIDRDTHYERWRNKLQYLVDDSREDFIMHHRDTRHGVIPVWVAVDVLDWGGLSYLYSFAPIRVREQVADQFGLSSSQLNSWLRALNVVRNVCAHHSRFFNRYYSITPKLPRVGISESLDSIAQSKDSTCAQVQAMRPRCNRVDPTGFVFGWKAILNTLAPTLTTA